MGGERRPRHSSGEGHHDVRTHNEADIKSQFLADLRRLGGNIPNNGDHARDSHAHSSHAHQHATASSTTNSPPAPAQSVATPTENENNLPPRKRKVSHEQAQPPRSPYNGIHESESPVKKEGPSDPENNPASVDCRN